MLLVTKGAVFHCKNLTADNTLPDFIHNLRNRHRFSGKLFAKKHIRIVGSAKRTGTTFLGIISFESFAVLAEFLLKFAFFGSRLFLQSLSGCFVRRRGTFFGRFAASEGCDCLIRSGCLDLRIQTVGNFFDFQFDRMLFLKAVIILFGFGIFDIDLHCKIAALKKHALQKSADFVFPSSGNRGFAQNKFDFVYKGK